MLSRPDSMTFHYSTEVLGRPGQQLSGSHPNAIPKECLKGLQISIALPYKAHTGAKRGLSPIWPEILATMDGPRCEPHFCKGRIVGSRRKGGG